MEGEEEIASRMLDANKLHICWASRVPFHCWFFWLPLFLVVVSLVEFAYLDFFACQGSYCRWFGSFSLQLCDAFWALTPSFVWFHKTLKKKCEKKAAIINYWRFQHFCHYILFVCVYVCMRVAGAKGWCCHTRPWPPAGVPKGVNTQVWKMFICGYAKKATNKTVTACTIRCPSFSFSLDALCGARSKHIKG